MNNEQPVIAVFETKALEQPDRIAVTCGNRSLTYGELNCKADKLAFALRRSGVTNNSIVALISDRSPEMIIGIYAIMKAGGVYFPVIPSFPRDRIIYMIRDSGTRFLLASREFAFLTGEADLVYIDIDGPLPTNGTEMPGRINSSPLDLAYLIYTSGSTGMPKGVIIDHQALSNRLNWMQHRYPIGPGDIILQKTAISFDVSVWELFWWGITGATVCLLDPGAERFCDNIVESIEKNEISIIHFVPSMLLLFLDYLEGQRPLKELRSLRQVFASGEALSSAAVKKFYSLLPDCQLTNLYGPTEATIDVSYYDCPKKDIPDRIPIGKPIDNTSLFIVDEQVNLLPQGREGELCIGGICLAKGYLNKEELTRAKFIKVGWHDTRLYRTGDRARQNADGNIEYLGRLDNQVKIRGNRIELNEIEYHLLRHPNILNAVATVWTASEESEPDIVAYLVTKRAPITVYDLRDFLGSFLPDYFIPSYFVLMEALPLSSSNKIDKKRLPGPIGNFLA